MKKRMTKKFRQNRLVAIIVIAGLAVVAILTFLGLTAQKDSKTALEAVEQLKGQVVSSQSLTEVQKTEVIALLEQATVPAVGTDDELTGLVNELSVRITELEAQVAASSVVGPVGPAGPAGPAGKDGKDGKDGLADTSAIDAEFRKVWSAIAGLQQKNFEQDARLTALEEAVKGFERTLAQLKNWVEAKGKEVPQSSKSQVESSTVSTEEPTGQEIDLRQETTTAEGLQKGYQGAGALVTSTVEDIRK